MMNALMDSSLNSRIEALVDGESVDRGTSKCGPAAVPTSPIIGKDIADLCEDDVI